MDNSFWGLVVYGVDFLLIMVLNFMQPHKDPDCSKKWHQFSRLGSTWVLILTHVYFFVALDMYILELYSRCFYLHEVIGKILINFLRESLQPLEHCDFLLKDLI